MPESLARIYDVLRSNSYLNLFVILLRYLVSLAFIPSGLKKFMGVRFTQMGVETPIGYFFEAMYQTGPYWVFLGFAQLTAAFLLMSQTFATLGAWLFFFIIGNIWVINVALDFSGTVIITSLMLLAVGGLLLWDWHKIRFLFARDNFAVKPNAARYATHSAWWTAEGIFIFFYTIAMIIVMERYPAMYASLRLGALAVLPLSVVIVFLIDRKRMFAKQLRK